jgi:hypothetical protein
VTPTGATTPGPAQSGRQIRRDRQRNDPGPRRGGWTNRPLGRDLCSTHIRGSSSPLNGKGAGGAQAPWGRQSLRANRAGPHRCPQGHPSRGDETAPIRNPPQITVRLDTWNGQRPKVPNLNLAISRTAPLGVFAGSGHVSGSFSAPRLSAPPAWGSSRVREESEPSRLVQIERPSH